MNEQLENFLVRFEKVDRMMDRLVFLKSDAEKECNKIVQQKMKLN